MVHVQPQSDRNWISRSYSLKVVPNIYIFIYQRILSPQYLTAPKNPWFSNEVYSIHISIQWGLFLGWFLVPGIHVVPWFTVRSPVIYDYHIATKKKMPKGEKSLEMSDYMYEISSN